MSHFAHREKQLVRPQGFAYIAFWQFMAFAILLLLIWVNEILDLPSLFYDFPAHEPNIASACILSAAVLFSGIIAVGNTYVQQRRMITGLLTVCSYCHKIRIEHESWEQIESYVTNHSRAAFSHGVCPDCFRSITGMTLTEANERNRPAPQEKSPAPKG